MGKLKVKVPEAEEEWLAGRAGLCLQPGELGARGDARYGARRRGRSSHGKLAREALAAHVLRPAFCGVWATPAAAGTGR